VLRVYLTLYVFWAAMFLYLLATSKGEENLGLYVFWLLLPFAPLLVWKLIGKVVRD
jgi:hypothetical protein